MKDTNRLEQIRKAVNEAIEARNAQCNALESAASQTPRPGDVYLFPGPTTIDLQWVVVMRHHEKSVLLFAVPADGHPLVGLTDVEVSADTIDPVVLRCGYGLWILQDEFRRELRVGILEERYITRVVDKLAQIGKGKLEGSASQRETEANPDYDDWLAEVESEVERLASALRVKEEELTAGDFVRPSLPEPVYDESTAEPQLALAAASSGTLDELQLTEGDGASEQGPPTRRLDFLYPGELFLDLETDGVAVRYMRKGDSPPPELCEIDAAGKEHAARWFYTPRNTAARALFAWRNGQVRLRFGHGEQARKVTVRQ